MGEYGGWDFGTGGLDLFGSDSGPSLQAGDFSNFTSPDFGDVATSLNPGDFSLPATSGADAAGVGNYDVGTSLGNGYNPAWAAAPGASPSQDTGGSGAGGVMSGLGKVAQGILPVAQTGLAGLGVYQGLKGMQQAGQQQDIARQAQQRQQEILAAQQAQANLANSRSNPLFAASDSALQRAEAGQISPAAAARIQQWKTGAIQAARAQAASTGQGSSTTLTQWEQWIDQQAKAMEAAEIERTQNFGLKAADVGGQFLNTGVVALGGGGQTANQSIAAATAEENNLNKLIADANNVLARINARG